MPEDCDIFPCCGDDSLGYEVPSATPNPPATTTFTLTLDTDPVDAGTVSGAGTWASDTFVEIEAFPAEGQAFIGWTGDVELSDNPAQVYMDGDKAVTANFAPIQVSLTISVNPLGSATTTGQGGYDYGDNAVATTIPVGYFQFDNYSGDIDSINNPENIVMDQDYAITANLSRPGVTLTGTVDPVGAGSISGLGDYLKGDTANVSGVSGPSSIFLSWTGDLVSEDNPDSLLMDGNKSIQANFIVCKCGDVDYNYLLHSPLTSETLLKTIAPDPDNPPGATYYRRKACVRYVCACIGKDQTIIGTTQYGGPTTSNLDLPAILFSQIAIPSSPGTYIYRFNFFGWRDWQPVDADRHWIRSDSKYQIWSVIYPGISS